tara:strand:- start:1149 stop:1403 length:255 start_codon:yes stop_codon:yes gene_type:complete
MNIASPIASQPVVEDNGTMAEPFRLWSQQVTDLQILTGSGTPEGTVSAPITTLYMDTAGGAGAVLYIKRDTDVAADPTQGWILV